MNKEMMAKMQIETELAATIAKLTNLSQYIDPKSEYAAILKNLQKEIAQAEAKLAAQ